MSTYMKVYYHVVFSTHRRKRRIPPQNKDRIHRYINGIVKGYGHDLLAAHCMPDHIHLLLSFHNDMKHSALIREIKKRSTRFINDQGLSRGRFEWQEGYGIFTCSESALPDVKRYIDRQEEHHRERSYEEEFIRLLEKHGISYDRRYLFK